MSASSKLSTAVKALCYLSEKYPEPKSSSDIAKSIDVNASKLRKILSYLVKCNIIQSLQGTTGGFLLNKKSTEIDLQEIYCAVEEQKAFHMDFRNNNTTKNSSKNINHNNFFLTLFSDIQVDIESRMKQIKLNKIIESIKE
jgi:Rrf2 family protein